MIIKVKNQYTVLLLKNNNAKRIIFKIDHDNIVKLVVPSYISIRKASIIANDNINIIEKLISRNKEREAEYQVIKSEYSTCYGNIQFKETLGIDKCTLDLEKCKIEYPFGLTGYRLKNSISTFLKTLIHKIALEVLPNKLHDDAARYDIKYRNLNLRCNKTRWGSCSTSGRICLDIKIVLLPKHLQDYIIAHELAHIREPNHSPKFWDHLSILLNGDSRLLRKELRTYKHDLFFYI